MVQYKHSRAIPISEFKSGFWEDSPVVSKEVLLTTEPLEPMTTSPETFDQWDEEDISEIEVPLIEEHNFKNKAPTTDTLAEKEKVADNIRETLDLGDDYHNYLIKDRIFYDSTGRKIEIVGTSDLGRCDKSYHSPGKTCIGCLINCSHTLKIEGKLQNREYTHIEVLKLQYGIEQIKEE